jgi:hypothetical protein
MHRFVSRFLALLLLVSVLLVLPVGALAAPADTSTSRYAVQFWPEGDPARSILIVSVTLPEDTPLPATVRLPLPSGAQVTWAGEIIGADIENDILRPHTFVDGTGGQSIEITLEQTLTAQYDANYIPIEVNGGDYSVTLDWVQTEPAEATDFAVRLPGTITDIVIDPPPVGDPQVNVNGERLYTLSPMTLSPGDRQPVRVEYTRPELAGSGGTGGVLPWLLGILAIAVVALVAAIVLNNRKRRDAEG